MQVPISRAMYRSGALQKIPVLDLRSGEVVVLCQPNREPQDPRRDFATQEEVTICKVSMCDDCSRLRVWYRNSQGACHGAAIATNGDLVTDAQGAPDGLFGYFMPASTAPLVTTDSATNGDETFRQE